MPGQRQTFPVDWDQRDQQGNYVAPGQYSLVAWLISGAAAGQPFQPETAAPPVTFTIQDMPVPAIPAAPSLTAAKGNGANLLSWTAVSGAAGYHVARGPGSDSLFLPLFTASADQTSFSDTDELLPGTKYFYTVRAFNIAGIDGPAFNEAIVQT
ncbi:MAG TPA: fibronectin type III domain-containing protein [Armatimonadota bacterium]|nr:fibronectin type III domain-containing protein [Armatimonadota bacterium]